MLCNRITALMLRRAAQQHFGVGSDGVVLNNAAASSVGRLFTATAERHRIATVSIVRPRRAPTRYVIASLRGQWLRPPTRTLSNGYGRPPQADPYRSPWTRRRHYGGELLSTLSPAAP